MIISRTPFRISFFGGGTDFPLWYLEHGGAVLSTTINKYAYITCRLLPPFFEHKHRIVYSQIETVNSTEDINHPAVRNIFKHLGIEEGLEIHYDGDLPARSGIGSRSSFTVGMLNTLFALRGQMKTKWELADLALHVEQNVIKETVGSQDQVAASFGGFNRIEFRTDGSYDINPVIMPSWRLSQLSENLMLFFTGFSRTAESVEKTKISNFKSKEDHLKKMRLMVDEAMTILQDEKRDINDFGRMLHEGWALKRGLSDKVSTSQIDEIYQAGLSSGAVGGKILGAGGGGFILFFVPPENRAQVKETFSKLIEVDFNFEYGGSQIILYNPELTGRKTWLTSKALRSAFETV